MPPRPDNNTVLTRTCRIGGETGMRAPGVTDAGTLPPEMVDRFKRVMQLTAPRLPGELGEQFKQLLDPVVLGIIAGTLAVWAASHFFGVGFVVDFILVTAGVITMGWTAWQAACHLVDAVQLTRNARTPADLTQAADAMARFVTLVGVEAALALLTRGAGKLASTSANLGGSSASIATKARTATHTDELAGAAVAGRRAVTLADDVVRSYAQTLGGVSTPVQHANLRTALKYFAEIEGNPRLLKGAVDDTLIGKLHGIDLSSDVQILTLEPGARLNQWVTTTQRERVHLSHPSVSTEVKLSRHGTGVGEYFSPGAPPAEKLGISQGVRELRTFELKERVTVLKSTAGPITDNWTFGRVAPADTWPGGQVVSRSDLPSNAPTSTVPGGIVWETSPSGTLDFTKPGRPGPASTDWIRNRAGQRVPGGEIQYYLPEAIWNRLISGGSIEEAGALGR
ncbi:MAG: hypothetical protein H7210_13320 [Pyrinomonadaceae bacterium]|nr:hypothetical protein [Phycisphaerales bacterium]